LAWAVAEASGAVDGPCREATARKQGESWRLTGAKSFVIDAAAADWLVVAAQDGQNRAFFLVEARDESGAVIKEFFLKAKRRPAGADGLPEM